MHDNTSHQFHFNQEHEIHSSVPHNTTQDELNSFLTFYALPMCPFSTSLSPIPCTLLPWLFLFIFSHFPPSYLLSSLFPSLCFSLNHRKQNPDTPRTAKASVLPIHRLSLSIAPLVALPDAHECCGTLPWLSVPQGVLPRPPVKYSSVFQRVDVNVSAGEGRESKRKWRKRRRRRDTSCSSKRKGLYVKAS